MFHVSISSLRGVAIHTISLPNSFLEACGRLALAALLGALIGLNRELRHKPAGLRTHSLVALGSALITLTSLYLTPATGLADISAVGRVMQGIVAGIGFLGAGVILHRDDSKGAHGLTTAASIWVVAAVGMTTALGLWGISIVSTVLLLLVFAIGGPIDRALRRRHRKDSHPANDD